VDGRKEDNGRKLKKGRSIEGRRLTEGRTMKGRKLKEGS
jgi:hypothetical protein